MTELEERADARPTAPLEPRAAAVAAVAALPDAAAPSVVESVVKNLTSSAQQDAAAAAVSALPDSHTPDVLARIIGELDAPVAKRAATAAVNALSEQDRHVVATSVLGPPDAKTQRTLWYLVVGTMASAVLVFGVLAFLLIAWGKPAEAPLALATTALGGTVGLVVASPVSKQP